jgi:hypothetical protein
VQNRTVAFVALNTFNGEVLLPCWKHASGQNALLARQSITSATEDISRHPGMPKPRILNLCSYHCGHSYPPHILVIRSPIALGCRLYLSSKRRFCCNCARWNSPQRRVGCFGAWIATDSRSFAAHSDPIFAFLIYERERYVFEAASGKLPRSPRART